MRKLLYVTASFLLAITLLIAPPAKAATFKDVTHHYWAYEDIQFIAKHQIIQGFVDGTFKPGIPLQRKDAAVIMARTLEKATATSVQSTDATQPVDHLEPLPLPEDVEGEKEVPSDHEQVEQPVEEEPEPQPEPTYVLADGTALYDIKPSSPGFQAIIQAIEQEWLTVKDGYFHPYDSLTRDEMSKLLATVFQLEGKRDSTFTDVPRDHEYYPYVDAIAMSGITTGYNDGTYRLDEVVTRAQFSAFVSRYYAEPRQYEVRQQGVESKQFHSLDEALRYTSWYEADTIHPVSNPFKPFSDEIGSQNKTEIEKAVLLYNGFNERIPRSFDPYMKATINNQTYSLFDTFIIKGMRYNEEGNMFIDGPSNEANYADWKRYIERTFNERDGILHKLNESAKKNNRKVDVYLTIPYPKRDGMIEKLDGREVTPSVYNRFDLVQYYLKETEHQMKQKDFSNLQLKGYYWLSETVRTKDDEVLTSSINGQLKQKGLSFVYSPHATSTNFHKWERYGFDMAYLQPNAFRIATQNKEDRLHRAYLGAQVHGAGIVFEIDSYGINYPMVEQARSTFDLYLKMAERYHVKERGFMLYQATDMLWYMATDPHPAYEGWYESFVTTMFDPVQQ